MPRDEEKPTPNREEEFLQVFKKGAEFTQELLRENERLRFRILELEQAPPPEPVSRQAKELAARVEHLEREKREILGRIRQVEEESREYAARYREVEEENDHLAHLYIASYQLHSTLDFKEVLQIIAEIAINLIGADQFAISLLDEKSFELHPVFCQGMAREEMPPARLGRGVVGRVARAGENHYCPDVATYRRDPANPMVCIPLKIKEQVIGVLSIYQLLPQKKGFAPVDYELFTLLAGHAATAIFSSRLFSEKERKLSTLQGFIDLLSGS